MNSTTPAPATGFNPIEVFDHIVNQDAKIPDPIPPNAHPYVGPALDALNERPKNNHCVVGIIGDIVIFYDRSKNPSFEDARYTGAFIVKENTPGYAPTSVGKWKATHSYNACPTTAFLTTLGQQHDGTMSQFGNYAAKMLGIH
jgi:hypothetical protein